MKLLLAVVVLACVAACSLAEDHKGVCGPLQKLKVKRQWDKAYGEAHHRQEFALHLWNHFFKDHPDAREVYKNFRGDNVYHPKFQAFSSRALETLTMVIHTTDDPEALKEIVAHAKADDAEQGITPKYYDGFLTSLLETLSEYLETHLDWDAWVACLQALETAAISQSL